MKQRNIIMATVAGLFGGIIPNFNKLIGSEAMQAKQNRFTYSTPGTAFTRGKRQRSQKIRANRRKAKAKA
jgi:hypothetical protein